MKWRVDPQLETPMFSAKERCKHSILRFCSDVLKVEIEIEDIWKAHRTGPYKADKVRPMVAKVSYAAKDLIMENLYKMKGQSNPTTKQTYFISEQVPEAITETKKQVSARAKPFFEDNDKKSKDQKSKIQIINDKIIVDGEVQLPEIEPPQPSQLLFLSKEQQQQVDKMQNNIIETDPEKVRNSEFIALAIKVHSLEEVNQAYIAVAQRHTSADHVMLGYALRDTASGKLRSGFCNNAEYSAGARIKKTIFESKARNTAVFVVRKYGGIHLGYNRFNVIESVAQCAIRLLTP